MENSSNGNDNQSIENFQRDFIKGCITFLTIAMQVRGEKDKTPDQLLKEFIDPIVGNRSLENTPFQVVIPELFKKVTEYCGVAIDITDIYDRRLAVR